MGLSEVERRSADALAELGYVALAFDLHGGRCLGDPEEMLARCMPLLADPDRIAAVGSEDPIMPPAQRNAFTAEMQAAGVDCQVQPSSV